MLISLDAVKVKKKRGKLSAFKISSFSKEKNDFSAFYFSRKDVKIVD